MTYRVTIASILSLCISFTSSAQEIKKSKVHLGFAYPLSTNGVDAAHYTNVFSAHAITGISYSESAFCASGIASIIKYSARGFVGSGIANIIGNKATGLQAAGILNYTRYCSRGLQAAGFINLTGAMRGAQAAGFANIADDANAQIAGFINVSDTNSAQVAGFINVSAQSDAQVAGFINVGAQSRAQVAGFANVAGDVNGTQVAGFINVAHKVKGAQIAGFINIADSCDYPIGFINIIKKGEMFGGVMVDETATTFATFRSGGRKLYGIVGLGFNGTDYRSIYALQVGLGAHMNISRSFRIDVELTNTALTNFDYNTDMQAGIRVLPAVHMGHFSVFAGPSINYAMSYGPAGAPFDHHSIWSNSDVYRSHEIYVGGVAGVQYRF